MVSLKKLPHKTLKRKKKHNVYQFVAENKGLQVEKGECRLAFAELLFTKKCLYLGTEGRSMYLEDVGGGVGERGQRTAADEHLRLDRQLLVPHLDRRQLDPHPATNHRSA